MTTTNSETTFVPDELDCSDFANLEPLYRDLLERSIETVPQFQQWLADASALDEVVDEYGSRRYVEHTCHTDDEQIEQAYMHFVKEIEPRLKPIYFELQKKYLASPSPEQLEHPPFPVLTRKWKADVELFRKENIPLQTRETELATSYGKICGAMMVTFRGKEYTLQQLSRFLQETDRATRKEAWELSTSRRLQDRDKIDDIFDQLITLRNDIAKNAGLPDYRAWAWKAKKRFDYTPEQCLEFGDTIEELVVPLVAEMAARRKEQLGVDPLRPWDLAVDPKGREPLRPFDQSEIETFVNKTRKMLQRLSPALGEQFATMKMGTQLDLESRKGKRPGGYQCSLEKSKQPFIFMNAAGLQGDVETLLHEGGHAFHYMAACETVPLTFARSAPIEFCEVASMSMELLAADYYDEFYDEADAARAKREALERPIQFLPWMATIDGFQHWLYTHPTHTRDERTAYWLSLMDRFSLKVVDWTGYDAARAARWQAQTHLFGVPFYYVEYGIAQLGALQIWSRARKNRAQTIADYRNALALGGTRPLPELFAAAGIKFDFSRDTIAPLIDTAREELDKLPD